MCVVYLSDYFEFGFYSGNVGYVSLEIYQRLESLAKAT